MDDRLIEELRSATPGCRNVIHFNNAGCSMAPQPVLDALTQYLTLEQAIGGYEAAAQQAAALGNYYTAAARLLNCDAEEIAWAESSTRAWQLLFQSLELQAGDKIVTGQSEYASNFLAMLFAQQQRGITIEVVANEPDGRISLSGLRAAVDSRTRLIALTHVPSQQGVEQPVVEVGNIARQHGLLYLLDASQSLGQMPVDVQAIGCHMLTGSGRKFLRGPRGTGLLYVSNRIVESLNPASVDLHAAEWVAADHYRLHANARRLENFEHFLAGKIALGVAMDYATALGIEAIQKRIALLMAYLRDQLATVPGISLHDPEGQNTAILTFSLAAEDPQLLQARLQRAGINSGLSKRANALVDFSRRGLGNVNRLSLHYYNTREEIDRLVALLRHS